MLNALRLTDGFDAALFADRTGRPISAARIALESAEAKGLLARDHRHIAPTALGRRFLNDLQMLFLPEARASRSV
jgi:oxygen-independent coproporphyrinogen-3 oxidase